MSSMNRRDNQYRQVKTTPVVLDSQTRPWLEVKDNGRSVLNHPFSFYSPDEEVEAAELNPFSFREFLRWKNQDPDHGQQHDQDQDQHEEQTHSQV